jgi:sarcosine oxidase
MEKFDVIVIGLGAMGSAACYHLARRGVRVLGLEQFDIPHAQGSSHGYSRMTRMAYYEHRDYVPLLRRAYELWDELEKESGAKVLHVTGGIYLGPAGCEVVTGSLAAAREHGLAHEELTARDIATRYPVFKIPENFTGLFEPMAGLLLPERVIAAHAEGALRRGADLRGRERVLSWESSGDAASVTTTRGTYRCKTVLFCGGPWTAQLVKDLGVPLTVTRQVLGWVWPQDPAPFALGNFPVWAIDRNDGTLDYGFPMLGPSISDAPGLKLAHHGPATRCDPDTVDRAERPGDEADLRHALTHYLPSAHGPLLSMRVCLYTNSLDHHFIVDRHPQHPNVYLACGFSGHGFKFASVMGEALADLSQHGQSPLPIRFLGLERFR